MSATNVDQSELAKFSSLAHRWWDQSGEFAPLHQINPLRLEWIDGLCPLAGQQVLDVGCGGGILAESMALRGAQSGAITDVVTAHFNSDMSSEDAVKMLADAVANSM